MEEDTKTDPVLLGLRDAILNGTEEDAANYIKTHYTMLPEELQQNIAVAIAEETMEMQAKELEAAVDFNKKVLQALTVWQMQKGSSSAS